MNLLDQVQARLRSFTPAQIKAHHLLLAAILLLAVFTRFWRLGTPDGCYFDEVYFPTTGAEILHGDKAAWEFYGHENTHPPLSKLFMAGGEAIFGHEKRNDPGLQCWGDQEDAAKKNSPDWTYSPFGWRFFGALAGVGAVLFMYLLARKLFNSEVAGLAGAFLLTFEGLAFTQSRIATPDTYVLFFMLGAVYFLVSDRYLFSGIFFGAAMASKWNAMFTIVPIVLYLAWRLARGFAERREEPFPREGLKRFEVALPAGLALLYLGVGLTVWRYVGTKAGQTYDVFGGPLQMLGLLLMIAGGAGILLGIAGMIHARNASGGVRLFSPTGRLLLGVALVFGVFFMIVPGYVYALTYVPMLASGHSLGDARDLNRMAYDFHSTLKSPHPYQSPFDTWPILMRPIFFYLGGDAKIYNLGNPLIFWLGLPALAFTLYRGLRFVRVRVEQGTANLAIRARITLREAAPLFVLLSYLGFWLPWALQPRILFLYHYLPALAFVILALAYVVHWLWYHEQRWARAVAITFLVAVAATFAYFYPHLAAVSIPHWLDESYYWFPSWR